MSSAHQQDDIAIIGMSGRFPGAKNVDTFWQNLTAGIESVTFLSDDELYAAGVSASLINNPNYVRASSEIDNVDLFDASFFGFSSREAEMMDPQHRIFMECAWEALENAGCNSGTYNGKIGVYAGSNASNYYYPDADTMGSASLLQYLIGNDKDYLVSQVSYKLGLTGPSISVQTACSTSLVAVSLAYQSLLNYECDIALAGGVSLRFPQRKGYLYEDGIIFSPDGHTRTFDARAQGTLFGSGVGVVVLKRLEDAIADRDRIDAVIRGAAINNDGSLKVGFTAPGVEGQKQVIALAQAIAGVKPEDTTYIEAHGSGTALGDPIEIRALTEVFRASTEKEQFCAVGSVKSNVGHLEAAAGIAGLIKTVLALKHRQLPPSLNFESANPQIDFETSPFYVNTSLTEWPRGQGPRRAWV